MLQLRQRAYCRNSVPSGFEVVEVKGLRLQSMQALKRSHAKGMRAADGALVDVRGGDPHDSA
jgi:hypothetical protein